jgi:hypothetical protein
MPISHNLDTLLYTRTHYFFPKIDLKEEMVVARFALPKGSVRHRTGTLKPYHLLLSKRHTIEAMSLLSFGATHRQIQTKIPHDAHLLYALSHTPCVLP